MNDVSAARSLAQRLRAAGVRLALDDFGTGFASLLYLRHLLFDFVKIDGEFVTELDTSETDCTIVRSIVDLAAELGMQAVAEHVGSSGVLDVVSREGIALAQGFGIGRPCTEDEFVTRHLTASSKER
ncbi:MULTISPECIES: EAL domain-containing protein [Dietzia]|uniref:EAL domain-containing protein n=1 Tax=Dietzia TaxID=37914 RepID=UPI0013EC51C7|nr:MULTISPECIES: EAL domain-containing protein [Dietzia]MCT1710453.1 EAL domain-containing protein [Dietzia cinnamea]MCT2273319.1 EAL domain-containing protein [Dietzia cinnamea]